MSSGSRVSIPNSVRKTIQNIKEIMDNHSEEEIYAMLKECSMDPNETAQKLLFQDTFHEVKRKRDRRKENMNNKESGELRWKPGMQGRGSRGGRGSYSTRYMSSNAVSGRIPLPGKENEINQIWEQGAGPSSLPISQKTKNKDSVSATSSVTVISNDPTGVASGSTTVVNATHLSAGGSVKEFEVGSAVDIGNLVDPPPVMPACDVKQNSSTTEGSNGLITSDSSNSLTSASASASGVYFSASDPVLPSHDSRLPGSVGAIKLEVGSQRAPVEHGSVTPQENIPSTATSEVGSSSILGKMPSKSQGMGKNQDSAQLPSSRISPAINRPPSDYNSRLQQAIGPQKAGPAKEWKPKPTNPNLIQGSGATGSLKVHAIIEVDAQAQAVPNVLDSNEPASELQRKPEDLHFPDGQHVIIPNHLHVPEDVKVGFVFGSFDASFVLNTGYNNGPESDRNPLPLSDTSEGIEETPEHCSSNQNALVTSEERYYPDQQQSPRQVQENLSSGEGDVSSIAAPEYNESDQEGALPPSHPYSMIHTSPSYNIGFMPPIVGTPLAPFDGSESQARDVPRVPSFVVQQSFDPSSYYGQSFWSGADSDGRISPFHSSGAASKYNGSIAVLSSQTSQSPPEGGNSLVLSSTGLTPLVTQATGVMQNSIAVTQQPLPVFRQPTGMHIPHYPPNYIPYGHYYPPFYVPPPAIHQFLSNGAFPQQPQAGSMYPAPPGATAKYSFPQYKPGTSPGNSNNGGIPGTYGPYGSSPAGYNPSSASTAANTIASGDLAASQFKENNVYMSGQQSEGSALWIAAPGREISGLQPSSFYNIPPQPQLTLAPTQAGHGTFAGIYRPPQAASTVLPLLQQSQTMAASVDMVGPTASVYQQAQHTQTNWHNSY